MAVNTSENVRRDARNLLQLPPGHSVTKIDLREECGNSSLMRTAVGASVNMMQTD